MFYYIVKSSHWPGTYEFKSEIKMDVGQCFRILSNDGERRYPTRFKVLDIKDTPTTSRWIVTVKEADLNVEQFD